MLSKGCLIACPQKRALPPHVSSPESGGASTSRQPYVSCTGCQSADEWFSRYPFLPCLSFVGWHRSCVPSWRMYAGYRCWPPSSAVCWQLNVLGQEIMGGSPIEAGGHDHPPLLEAKGHRGAQFGNNSYLIGLCCSYHAFTLTSTPCRLYPGRGALRRQLFCNWRPLDSEITTSHVRG